MLINGEPGRVDSLECDHKGDFRDRLRKDVGLPGIALLRTSVFHVETIVVVAARVLWREAYDSEGYEAAATQQERISCRIILETRPSYRQNSRIIRSKRDTQQHDAGGIEKIQD